MPKKVSKRKPKRQPKKVSRKKLKKVTKRKQKYKRRKRRFGTSMASENRSLFQSLLRSFYTEKNPIADRANSYAKDLGSGAEFKKTPNFPDLLKSLRGEKKVMGLYNAFHDSSSFKKIGNDSDAAVSKRHRIFHTWLVAIISAILQLINETGRLKRNKYFDKSRVEGKYLGLLSNPENLKGIVEYTNLPTGQTGITEFNMQQRQGVLVGFTWKFRNDSLGCSMVGRVQQEHLIINTIFTEFENRMREARSAISKGPQHFQDAVAAYSTVINLRNGDIQSSQVSQDNNSVNQLTEGLGNMTMTVNPTNTIKTTVQAVNNSTNPFTKDYINPVTEIESQQDDGYNPFDEFGPKLDGKPFAGPEITYLFGRRKRKRKVSKKKGPSAALKKLCKSLKVKLTTKRGGKRVYKSDKVLKAQCKKAAKKSSFGKKPTKIPLALKKKCKRYNIRLTTGKKRVPKTLKKLKKDLDDKLKKIKIRKQKGRANLIKKAPFYAKQYAKYRVKRSLATRATGSLLRSLAKGRPSLFGKNREIEAVKNTKCENIKGCNNKPKCCKRVKKALINMYKGKATAADKKLIVSKKHFSKGDVDIINYCWNPKNSWKCKGAGIAAGGVIGGLSGLLITRSMKKNNKIRQVDFGKKKKRKRTSK